MTRALAAHHLPRRTDAVEFYSRQCAETVVVALSTYSAAKRYAATSPQPCRTVSLNLVANAAAIRQDSATPICRTCLLSMCTRNMVVVSR
eukprot:270092-Rhodomonas_salina.1